MNQNSDIFFHLGLSKVASTYFQQSIFPYLEDVRFYKKHHFERFREFEGKSRQEKLLFSSERDRLIVEHAGEILKSFPEAKLIIFVRRQDDWILSRYKYGIRKYGRLKFSEFFSLENDQGEWNAEDLMWGEKIRKIEAMCKNKPLVLTFDSLKKDREGFTRQVLDYLNTSLTKEPSDRLINTAFNEKQLIGLRTWNNWVRYYPHRFKSNILTVLYRRSIQYLLHIVAFTLLLTPRFLFRKKSLLSSEETESLEKIREYYKEDWEYCQEYEKTHPTHTHTP